MPKIELSKIYNSSSLTESGGKWTDFDGFQGSEVELFLKDKLEDSVVSFQYHNTGFETPDTKEILNNVLVGYNAFGNPVCYERIINADPTYTYTFGFQNVNIGSNSYTQETTSGVIQVNKTDNLTASIAFSYILTGSIAGSEFNEASPQTVTFKWFKDQQGDQVDATLDTLTRTITPGESISVDISKMFENAFSGRYLGVTFYLPKSTTEVVQIFGTPFTLRKLELSYKGELLINTPTLPNITLEGVSEDLSEYYIQYYLDNTNRIPLVKLDGGSMTPSSIRLDLPNLTEGAHDVFMRITNEKGTLTSNYIQIGFIYQKTSDSVLSDAVAMVSEVPNEIDNCNLSKFFKVITTANLSGNIEIIALKSSVYSNIVNINTIEAAKVSKYLFKEISLSLLSTDPSKKVDYTSYIEVPGNEDSTEYLKILIKDGTGVRTTNYYSYTNTIGRSSYKNITIKNPKDGSTHLQHTVGSILDFSQISNGNFFTDLNPNLDSSDGLQLETVTENTEDVTLTTFKVSPNSGVFAQPKKLISAGNNPLHKGAFSIEMMFKTYSIADLEDKIMTIGNITLCPKHLFINYNPHENTKPHHIVNASRADFRKDVLQHIVITYDPEYKPSTYEKVYDMLFTSGSTSYSTSAKPFPCLKVYVNGTINRIISVGSGTICSDSDFKLQIHPSNSNINFYIFRTYDKVLNYEEVKKNRISAMSKLEDKRKYYLDNEILYLSSDFAASDVSKKSSILNTISLGKCINKFRSVSNPTKQYKDRRVLLLVLPEGVLPPYYGNRKEKEPKAAFLVHYPETMENASNYSGRLSGGKVKAQGSSAKKYMIHNTSYSKFVFTPESQFNVENPTTYEYYKMPGSDIEIAKLVGKVNYASSMQSHKQGATKLFHEAYVNQFSEEERSWMNGSRKAVLEDDFLYFFVNVPKDDLTTITWDYFKQEDGTYNFENCHFLGFQTWGSAKGDKPTSGYDKSTPHYLMLEGADNDNAAANFKVPWAAMQLWGNYNGSTWDNANSTVIEAPADTPVSGKNYLHQFSGGTNISKATAQDPYANIWEPEYFKGLLIDDETIVFNPGTETENSSDKKADAWDVDFGFTEGDGYVEKGNWYLDGEEVEADTPGAVKAEDDNLFFVFEDDAKESVKRFAQFYNLIYTFDFSSLLYIPHGTEIQGDSMEINGVPSYQHKLIFGPDCTIKYPDKTVRPNAGDIYRWEKAWPSDVMKDSIAKWVPGGLYHNGKDWESLNIAQICTWYSRASRNVGKYPSEYSFFASEKYNRLRATEDQSLKYVIGDDYVFRGYDDAEVELINMQACMAEAFKIVCHEFLDVEDVAYHQAFCKLVAGTDNRAKNTYFQIIGPIYTDKATVEGFDGEVSLVKISSEDEHNKKPGFIKDGVFYTVSISDSNEVTTTSETIDASTIKTTKQYYYKWSGKGDYKIRLYQDDLDTIFKTDNNGQQVKPYYMMEPPFNKDLEELWGDMHSGFFYNFDLTFTEEVKNRLGKLLTFLTGNQWPDNPTTKAYEYFFSIQNAIPSIAYNHQSEIYYESAQVFLQNETPTAFYDVFAKSGVKSWEDYNNNKVANPVSLSHGSCLEAEIEYLRDRVLLFSTYTNQAKKETDVGILLSGGSATTQGKEVTIASKYTSFVQYIYPIINNIQSHKTTTSLQYDPLLDYVSWNNINDYNKIDLAYDIALPNDPLDMSVTFTHSPLTTQAYWTSTDLYRTIHITSGTEAFGSLFSFPNASTVISQDPSYNISISENKEIEVVEHLEGIEHLVLQEATINSSGLDFTGCNRLKTLIMGSTENNLTDSPEGTPPEEIEWYAAKFVDVLNPLQSIKVQQANASTGFQQIILPKSNSVEQVILPNCVKIANINYYPNLRKLEFNPGTQLTNLTIDGRNPNAIIEYLITNFVGTHTTNLEINNIPENFWLSEESCRKFAQITNVKLTGVNPDTSTTIKVGDGVNLKAVDWTTRKLLVEKFGNIDTGSVIFTCKWTDYGSSGVSINATGSIESSGAAPLQLKISGNNVPIDTSKEAASKRLKIYYTIKNEDNTTYPSAEDIRFVNKWTPQLIIKEGLKGVYKITTQVFITSSTSCSVTTTLTVGFYAPKVGDFAYANGSFSSVCDTSQGLVGVVFYRGESQKDGKKVYDIRVLSKDFSSTDMPLGPATYAIDFDWDKTRSIPQEKYKALLEKLGLDATTFMGDVIDKREGGSPNGTIRYNSTIDSVSLHDYVLKNTEERILQKNYIKRAMQFISKIKGKEGITVTGLESDDFDKPTAQGKANFEKALQELKVLGSIEVSGVNYTNEACGGFNYALYPAFLKALYYEPNVSLSGYGIDYFGIGNWYVPDARELEKIIFYRINSSILDDGATEYAWNNTSATGIDVSEKDYNVFSQDAFDNISFLGDTLVQIASKSSPQGEGYVYGVANGETDPKWHMECGDYATACARDVKHNISPVCRIELIER